MKYVEDPELLIKYCEAVSDDDEVLQNCPFVYEYDGSPQSSPSVAVIPSQPTGILMLSVPSTDSDGQSSPHENEVFETPPEQNNSSQTYFSGSDDLKPSTSAAVDSHANRDTDAVNRGNTEAVDLGNDSDDLGFSNRREIDEQLPKRCRVSEEDLGMKTSVPRIVNTELIEIDETQTQEVDTEVIECEENFKVYARRIGRKADSSTVKMSEGSDEKGDGEEVSKNGEGGVERNADSSTVKMSERGAEEGDGGEVRDYGEKGVERNAYSSTVKWSESGEEEGVGGELGENSERVVNDCEKLKGVDAGEMHLNGIKDGVGDGGKGVVSMSLDEREKENGVCAKEMHSNRITTTVGVGAGSVEGRRELPLSMRGGDKNVGSVEEVLRREAKNGRFKDLMEAISMVIGNVSGDDKNDGDFFETAKKRGMTFPRPRWWPPEGFSD